MFLLKGEASDRPTLTSFQHISVRVSSEQHTSHPVPFIDSDAGYQFLHCIYFQSQITAIILYFHISKL